MSELDTILGNIYRKQQEIQSLRASADETVAQIHDEISPLKDQAREELERLISDVIFLAGRHRQHVDLYFSGGPEGCTSYYVSSEGDLRYKDGYGSPRKAYSTDIVNMILGGDADVYERLVMAKDRLT